MNRVLTYVLILALVLALGGCAGNTRERAFLDGLEGSWYSEYEELRILGEEAEFTGYYDLDGQRMAGVVTLGTVSVGSDGNIEIRMDGYTLTGRLDDENTLILGNTTYTR